MRVEKLQRNAMRRHRRWRKPIRLCNFNPREALEGEVLGLVADLEGVIRGLEEAMRLQVKRIAILENTVLAERIAGRLPDGQEVRS